MKAVLLSIQPYYVFLIIARLMGWNIPQDKTVEVRKDFPKDKVWNKLVHIYCSKNRKSFNRIPKQYQPLMAKFLGEVIGEFVCDRVDTYGYGDMDIPTPVYDGDDSCIKIGDGYFITNVELEQTSLTYDKLYGYGKGEVLYGWHISNLKIYDEPKELGEFFTKGECQREFCAGCKNFHRGEGWLDGSYCDEDCCIEFGIKPLSRPPQSWCYCEGLSE